MTTKTVHNLRLKLKLALATTLISYAALLVLFTVDNLFRTTGDWRWWAIQSLPLLIFVPGILLKRFRTYSWMCFVVLMYFTAYVVEVSLPSASWVHWCGLVLSIVLFNSAMLTSRWMQYFTLEQEEAGRY